MITAFVISFEIRIQKIREKEKPQYEENDNQLYDDNAPELFANGHVFKTLVIEEDNIHQNFSHSGLGVLDPASSTYFHVPSCCFFHMEI
jgi:hypothetical protein